MGTLTINTQKKLEKFLKSYGKGGSANILPNLQEELDTIIFDVNDPVMKGLIDVPRIMPKLPTRELTTSMTPTNCNISFGFVEDGRKVVFTNVFKLYQKHFGDTTGLLTLKMTNGQEVSIPVALFMSYMSENNWPQELNQFMFKNLDFASKHKFRTYASMIAGFVFCKFYYKLPQKHYIFGLRVPTYNNSSNTNLIGCFELFIGVYTHEESSFFEDYLREFCNNDSEPVEVFSSSFFISSTKDKEQDAIFAVKIDQNGYNTSYKITDKEISSSRANIYGEVRGTYTVSGD